MRYSLSIRQRRLCGSQYTINSGPVEQHLRLNTVAPPKPGPDQHLVKICLAALNPDYTLAEIPIFGRFTTNPKPATPGIDHSGIILQLAVGSSLKPGQKVIGAAGTSYFAGGAFRETAIAKDNGTVALPEGVSLEDGATAGAAGLTAYQSIVPHVQAGSKVLIPACKVQDVLTALPAKGQYFDHVVDNVGDLSLFSQAHHFTKATAGYVFVAGAAITSYAPGMLRGAIPIWLGGPQRKFIGMMCEAKIDEAKQIGQ